MGHEHRRRHAVTLVLLCSLNSYPAFASGTMPNPSDSLSVRGCVALATAGSFETMAARWSALAAERDAQATRRNAAPAFRVRSGALIAPSGFYDPAVTNLGQYDLKLVMDLNLLDGGQRRRERARSQTSARAAAADLTAAMSATALEAARLASAVLTTRGQIERRREQERWTAQVLDAVQSGARSGRRSPSDVYRLRLDLQTLSMDRADLESTRASSARTLGAFLMPGSAGARFEAIRDTFWNDAVPSTNDSLDALRRFEASAEVRRAEATAGLAQLDLESARHQRSPQLGLSVDAGLAGTDLTRLVPPGVGSEGSRHGLSDRLRRDRGASLSLDLSLPLHPPGLASTIAAREADVKSAQLRLQRAKSDARLGALDLLARWNDGARRLAATDTAAALAESNLLRVRSLYLAGSVTLLELLDARRAWQDTEDRREAVRNDLHMIMVESEIER
jgi:outer membrane protein TolC